MIRIIEGLPDKAVGFEAVGEVSSSDYDDVLEPAIRAATGAHDKIRLLLVLGDEFEGYSRGGMWEDTKLGLSHWTSFERIAVVTDHTGYRDAVNAFGWMIPGKVKTYELDGRSAAQSWISEP